MLHANYRNGCIFLILFYPARDSRTPEANDAVYLPTHITQGAKVLSAVPMNTDRFLGRERSNRVDLLHTKLCTKI